MGATESAIRAPFWLCATAGGFIGGALAHGQRYAIAALLAKAENADSTPLEDGLRIPDEVTRRQERRAKLAAARAE
ncbi:MAG: hypothetical protein WCE49_04140, partial [Terrimicrobiaceae bacterium]